MTKKIQTGGPVFPTLERDLNGMGSVAVTNAEGMTLRDYFAAKIVVAMLGSAWNVMPSEAPEKAYLLADLMLKARAQ